MTIEVFAYKTQRFLQEKLGESCQVTAEKMIKNNGTVFWTVRIHKGQFHTEPVIYLDSYFEKYQKRNQDDGVLEELADWIREDESLFPEAVSDCVKVNIKNLDWVRNHLTFRLINRERNESLLKDVPGFTFHDLAVVCALSLEGNDRGMAFSMIHKEHMKLWDITEKELFAMAYENTVRLLPPYLVAMERILTDPDVIKRVEPLEDTLKKEKGDQLMYVLSNTAGVYGAGVILYPKVLEKIAECFGADLVILPSSCHEVLILPKKEELILPDLCRMVQSINRNVVRPEEVLSDSVYIYNRNNGNVFVYKNGGSEAGFPEKALPEWKQ